MRALKRVHCVAIAVAIALAADAQNGWIAITGAAQHAYYSTRHHTQALSPTVESEYGMRYRHEFGKRVGLLLGWRFGQRSLILVRQANDNRFKTPLRSEFEVAEIAPLIGICRQLVGRRRWDWHILLAIEGRIAEAVKLRWTYAYDGTMNEKSDNTQLPTRLAFRLGLRCSWRATSKLSILLEPHVLLVKPSRFDYDRLPDNTGKVFVGETRCTMGLDLGIELGPLFRHAPSHGVAE